MAIFHTYVSLPDGMICFNAMNQILPIIITYHYLSELIYVCSIVQYWWTIGWTNGCLTIISRILMMRMIRMVIMTRGCRSIFSDNPHMILFIASGFYIWFILFIVKKWLATLWDDIGNMPNMFHRKLVS